ncbi:MULTISPECIES: long-chain-fatty-acid--CoA ligase [Alkalihalophilus]|uniref:long-chain-fatty-acid--CoA ligase n=1 Tax=Alkalihalophilus TaxID=2893060 RepID=UPI00095260D9|nr:MULTISPECIES: long-chain-fatty-acid--CoA ligase [Alkalihalophilus]MEC2071680.1 long-chain-fatty-acid--CoA ligase [Alkalihalophilus marmarensis]OLS39705.1 long-chain fatty acid--CoA ligase [Alkalihalophilus pseudofirmus]WEG16168.1 long-chain-fatty-acid--CoA ligase [Alkalihalophilus pseudofirmus]
MSTVTEHAWVGRYHKEIPANIEYPSVSLHELVEQAAHKYPNNTALEFMGKSLTYSQFDLEVRRLANHLQSLGLKKGERVAIMLPNCPQGVIAYFATLLAGGVVVQTNPLYVERELEHQLSDSGAKIILCLDLLYPRVMKVKNATSVEHIIVTAIKDYLPFPKNLIYPFIQKKNTKMTVNVEYSSTVHPFLPFVKAGSDKRPEVDVDPREDLALLQYTGGTTGLAKGVMLTHRNLVANTIQCRHWMYKMKEGQERTLAVLPFFHVYGMTVSMNLTLMNGNALHIVPKFDPKEVLKIINKKRITIFPGAPTMYIGLINHPDVKKYDLSSIEACISGSASLPQEVQQKFEELTGGRLVEGYGLTEASPVTHCNLLWGDHRQASIGLPWPDTEAVILSMETGEPVEQGEVGELAVRGPQIMKGYWNRPEATQATMQDDWLLTGDMGYMDEEGYFYIVDRKKDMIIAGGFNIYPREIEEVLYNHEDIQEAVAIGVPDEYRGETVKVFVVLKEGKQLTEKELNQYCRKHLAAYKVPRLYEFREELPKTIVGKILKRVLIEEEKEKTAALNQEKSS